MFWRFGGYANISAVDTLLEKSDVTLEELLDEGDLIQELKSHNTKLIEYLREDTILERLLEYVVATKLEPITSAEYDIDEDSNEEKGKSPERRSLSLTRPNTEDEEDEKEKRRSRYAFVAAEILASDSWSLSAALVENQALLRKFWEFLACPPPLDPLQAGYFTKVNEALLDKKTEEMLELFKSIPGVVKNMLQHVDSPMVMDLLLKIISLEKAEGGQGIVDWLHSQDLMPILLSFLSSEHSWATQTSAGDFLKAIITISANASQNEQSCIGPNELTRQLVSQPCIEKLISDMLKGGNPLTVGVGIVIEVIRKNNSDYDPDVGVESHMAPSSRDPIYLGTLLRMFAKHVPDFMALILSPDHTIGSSEGPVTIKRKELNAAFGGKVEPLGFDRFKTCELMAELLHCSNMGLLNEQGSEEFVRARDTERERLKAEGKLEVSGDRFNLESDDLTMKSSITSRLGSNSPDDMRRLEIQNASDDGFEEVTHSQDFGEDAKDDFDEKSDVEDELLANLKPESYPSFLDKDDEEFVDEPLSSPRFKTDAEPPQPTASEASEASLAAQPSSPTHELCEKVEDLKVIENTKSDKPPSYDDHSKDTPISSDAPVKQTLDEAIDSQTKPKAEEKVEETPQPTLEILSGPETHADELSPRPEDHPAPLFSKRKYETLQNDEEAETPIPQVASQVSVPEDGSSLNISSTGTEIEDSTMMDVDGTIQLEDSKAFEANGDQAVPVVGDYLKMQFVEHKVVPTILDFFFRFPWNNFLHNVVYDVVQQVFNGPMDRGYNRTLAIDLFDTGNITHRIVDGQNKSDEAQRLNRMRLGYMGHLTLIAEEVVKFTERHPPELLSDSVFDKVMNSDWVNYVEVILAETRERDNAILGGVRPDQNLGPRQSVNGVNSAIGGGSSALADAGLNGNASLDGMDLSNGSGTSAAGFTLTSGSLLSGFGSSSDEEDEEMDDDLNDDDSRGGITGGVEFSRYISTPSTTTATSTTSAPSDLDPTAFMAPPPPPLNIPPSRARRQLAARLALHNRKAQEAANGEAVLSSSPDGKKRDDNGSLDLNVNPFADTDSDDDDLEIEGMPSGATTSPWEPRAVGEHLGVQPSEQKKEAEGFDDNFDDDVGLSLRGLRLSSHVSDPSYSGDGHGVAYPNSGSSVVEKAAESAEQNKPRSISPLRSSSSSSSTNFPTLWPFGGHASRGHRRRSVEERYGRTEEDEGANGGAEGGDGRANDFFAQSDSGSDSDGGFDGVGAMEASGEFHGEREREKGRRRRPSLTREAKSRTSLDDEEVVEVVVGKGEGVVPGPGTEETENLKEVAEQDRGL